MPAARASDEELIGFFEQTFACSRLIAEHIGLRATERRWVGRSVILHQGDAGAETFLLVGGRAQAMLYGADGQLVMLQEYLPGDIFGAIAELEPASHDADIVAAEPVRAAVFPAADFLGLMETHGCVGLAVSRLLLKQLRNANGRMAERATLSAVGRICSELIRLARAGDGRTIRPAPVLAALAVRAHSTRETASRTINTLERRGVIRRDADSLVIVAPHRLEEMMI